MFRKKDRAILGFLKLAALQILNNQIAIMLALKRSVPDKEVHEQIMKSAEITEILCDISREVR